MNIAMSELLQDMLFNGCPKDIPNPIYMENGQTWIRHDEIRQSNMYDALGGLKTAFYYKGSLIYWTRVRDVQFENSNTLTIQGIEGRQMFNLLPMVIGDK